MYKIAEPDTPVEEIIVVPKRSLSTPIRYKIAIAKSNRMQMIKTMINKIPKRSLVFLCIADVVFSVLLIAHKMLQKVFGFHTLIL